MLGSGGSTGSVHGPANLTRIYPSQKEEEDQGPSVHEPVEEEEDQGRDEEEGEDEHLIRE